MNGDAKAAFIVGFIVITLLLYGLPSYVAFRRGHPNRWLILALNMTLGSTGIGWLLALIWAMHAAHRPQTEGRSRGGESGLNLFVNDPKLVEIKSPGGKVINPPKVDVAAAVADIERLKRLHQRGQLTELEFGALKDVVLRQLG